MRPVFLLGAFAALAFAGGTARAADPVVGTMSSMAHAMPRGAGRARVTPAAEVNLRLARRERESVQVLVTSRSCDLENVRVEVGDLRRDRPWWKPWEAATLSAANVDCHVTGYVWTEFPTNAPHGVTAMESVPVREAPGYRLKVKTCTADWYPDPILDFLPSVKVARGDVQSFWIRVRCPSDQPAGTYRGMLSVVLTPVGGAPTTRALPFVVRVNDFAVPAESPLPLAVTFGPMTFMTNHSEHAQAEAKAKAADPQGPVALANGRLAEWGAFLADYYLTMDSLYTRTNLHWDVLARLRDEGRLGRFNLGYWDYPKGDAETMASWRERTLPRLRRNYEKARELGILGKAYLYGCDEVRTNWFDSIRACTEILRREFPGVPLATTAYDETYGVGSPLAGIDWFTPKTSKYDPVLAAKARAEGRRVGWYVCNVPGGTYANGFVQDPAIDLRMLMGAQTVRMRPDGFLYYELTIWNAPRPIERGPFTDWWSRSYLTANGDGCWTAVGPGGRPLSTQRLENFRDGLEDYAYALLLEEKLAAHPDAPWASEARRLLSVPREVMDTMENYTLDPAVYAAWRNAMADLIEGCGRSSPLPPN